MFNLSHAVPTEALGKLVPGMTSEVLADTVAKWQAAKSNEISAVCLFVWDEMVSRGLVQDPYKIGPVLDDESKGIFEFVEGELGQPPVSSAFSFAARRHLGEASFADISIVRCYPGDIHICDVEFSDFSRPLPMTEPSRQFRAFRGLHVFGEFLERLVEVARSQDAERISLIAAHRPLYGVFARHGFKVSETENSKRAFAIGKGFPMILHI